MVWCRSPPPCSALGRSLHRHGSHQLSRMALVTASANSTAGSYTVVASVDPSTQADFELKNTPAKSKVVITATVVGFGGLARLSLEAQ